MVQWWFRATSVTGGLRKLSRHTGLPGVNSPQGGLGPCWVNELRVARPRLGSRWMPTEGELYCTMVTGRLIT